MSRMNWPEPQATLYRILYGRLSHHHAKIASDALAEQIVIECEVEHHTGKDKDGLEYYWTRVASLYGSFYMFDKRGTPGKAIAIIVGLEEEDGD